MNTTIISAPGLLGERIGLRAWRIDDLDDHLKVVGDSAVQEGYPFEEALDKYGAWRQLCELAGHWELCGFGHWVVYLRDDEEERLIGDAGFMAPYGWSRLENEIELGWTFRHDKWGKGYATEAASLALEWAWKTLPYSRVVSLIPAQNEGSKGVARRVGMSCEDIYEMRHTPFELWTINSPRVNDHS